MPTALDWQRIDCLIEMALAEDLSDAGDTTSQAVIPAGLKAKAVLRVKEPAVCAGLPVAEAVFKKMDSAIVWRPLVKDGGEVEPGTVLAEIKGSAIELLTAERTALNFLQRLCGIATTAAKYAAATAGTNTMILDTRKTTPGWRNLEKYAVQTGGAANHRVGLYDRVMIKDNHRFLAGLEGEGGITRSVRRAREKYPRLEVEVEADTLEEVAEAIKAGADHILLDNMDDDTMARAVALNGGESKLEASGGVTLARIPAIAAIGVDFISVGALTHSVKAIDISMEMKPVN